MDLGCLLFMLIVGSTCQYVLKQFLHWQGKFQVLLSNVYLWILFKGVAEPVALVASASLVCIL